MKRVKAYTFIELMVVMIIGTITIAIAYQGYLLFYKQFLNFKNTSEKNASIVQLDVLLFSDFKDSKEVRKKSNGVVCLLNNKKVEYLWSDNYIVRRQVAVVDTFPMKISGLKFEKDLREPVENELVDGLSFDGNDGLHFMVFKTYGADVLINSEIKK